MYSFAVKLALAASLALVGAIRATAQERVTTGDILPARASSELDVKGELGSKSAVRAGSGFSPFSEEGLVAEMPPARHPGFRAADPAYLREFRSVADPP